MARYNQQAGRTSEAWRARYQQRSERAQREYEQLVAAGVDGLTLVDTPVSGPGVQGGLTQTRIAQYGRVLSRAELTEALSHDA